MYSNIPVHCRSHEKHMQTWIKYFLAHLSAIRYYINVYDHDHEALLMEFFQVEFQIFFKIPFIILLFKPNIDVIGIGSPR